MSLACLPASSRLLLAGVCSEKNEIQKRGQELEAEVASSNTCCGRRGPLRIQQNTTKPYLGGYYGSHSSSSDSSGSSGSSRPLPPRLPAGAPRERVLVSVWGWAVLMPPTTRLIDTIS
jgi:hypothetical protein